MWTRWTGRLRSACAGGVLAVAALSPAMAQTAGGSGDVSWEHFAFAAADTDGDGIVNEAEMARDAAVGFATLDKDGSGTLTPAELGTHDAAAFAKVDANSDGTLTFIEVMTNKAKALKAGDINQDGGLSFDEMVTIVETETGGAS